jgi:hypothetical protein
MVDVPSCPRILSQRRQPGRGDAEPIGLYSIGIYRSKFKVEVMPRYFFNVHIGDDALVDPDGQDLRDPDQAWEVAKAMAQNLMNTEFEQPVNWASSHIQVRDDLDEIVLEFPFLEAIQFTPQSH